MSDFDKLRQRVKVMGERYEFEHTKYPPWDYFTIRKARGRNWFDLRVDNTIENIKRCNVFLDDVPQEATDEPTP